ncbi:fatty acid CoA ligase family protein [Lacunisphaera limnophila]|uniref:fatty acid CoA ligase family protein n=1 Tax=Lacunisphaera limnophila TaxID=1838286 RepID=UPI001EEE032D|nr:fatty acid CoA ligase family protein [Lacunisphaera limnophila]
MSASANIARHLPLMATRQPDHPAIKVPRGRTGDGRIDYLALSFRELDTEVDAWVARLQGHGVQTGDRVLVMVRQGLPLIAAAFALFKLGAVPVIIDPGMGRKNFLACVTRSRPRVLLGIPLAQLLSHVFRAAFKSVEIRVWVSGSPTARAGRGAQNSKLKFEMVSSRAADLAAVLFTSGSTGEPKGVCYEHGMFDAQVRLVRDTYGIQPGEVDLPMLPIFALFNPALGMTTIVPEIDPARPATVDPAKIVQAIQQEGVTNSFGSPTLWRKISRHCREKNEPLPTLRRVLMAGAPVPPALFADLQVLLPNGTAHSPYGATEALPLATISGPEVVGAGQGSDSLGTSAATAAGAGTCVGRPVAEIQIRIIPITDGPIVSLTDTRVLPPGEIGEIIASGPVVTQTYDQLPAATTLAKIQTPNNQSQTNGKTAGTPDSFAVSAPAGAAWHRLGDLGYLDTAGRLWFCGRKAERVLTADGPLYTEQVEPIFGAHPDVARVALIGAGHDRRRPAIVVEPRSRDVIATPSLRRKLVRELRALGAPHPHTDRIRLAYLHPHLPVDVRHNAKIHRLTLARWAVDQQGYEMDKREVPVSALKR